MSSLPNPDPVNTPWHRLFLFWEAYNKEFINLLNKWHDDTAQIRRPGPGPLVSSGNVLYDSFLDTWGGGNFEDPNVPLDKKSYFAALAIASIEPRAKCFEVLKDILETTQPDRKEPPLINEPLKLKVSQQEANAKAQEALDQLEKRFSNEFDFLHDDVDPKLREAIGESRDTYLKALIRMMDIETECFKVQRDFLKTGTVS
jgi:hypothetical protein